jgi:hypothetical protein
VYFGQPGYGDYCVLSGVCLVCLSFVISAA